ncbi:hypothetical protein [Oricola sp.]|uniref:hypothetical protein n=1 Tax=Oricola sp. TaxID=1979950 RepID=UPI003BAC59E5
MLRVEIAENWEPQDFIDVLQSIESMYYKLSFNKYRHYGYLGFPFPDEYYSEFPEFVGSSIQGALDYTNRRLLEIARYEVPQPARLMVGRIEYASPGWIDFVGLGKVVEVISDSIGRMVTYYDERHMRRERDIQASIETEERRVELERDRELLQSLKIQNARDALEILERYPSDREVLVPLLVRDQDALSDRIAEGKLVRAQRIPEE